QAEFLHLHLQALAGDLEEPGGARDVPSGDLETADDEVALDRLHLLLDDLLERTRRSALGRLLRRWRRFHRRLAQAGRQFLKRNAGTFGEEDGPLEDVLQLADVSRPGIGHEASERVVLDLLHVL